MFETYRGGEAGADLRPRAGVRSGACSASDSVHDLSRTSSAARATTKGCARARGGSTRSSASSRATRRAAGAGPRAGAHAREPAPPLGPADARLLAAHERLLAARPAAATTSSGCCRCRTSDCTSRATWPDGSAPTVSGPRAPARRRRRPCWARDRCRGLAPGERLAWDALGAARDGAAGRERLEPGGSSARWPRSSARRAGAARATSCACSTRMRRCAVPCAGWLRTRAFRTNRGRPASA